MTGQAPRPHVWTIALAIAAFLVSAASLWYSYKAYGLSYKAYRLSRETSRSVLDVRVDPLNDWAFDKAQEHQKPLNPRITLYHNGKSVIAGILMRVYPLFCYNSTNIDPKSRARIQACVGEKQYSEVYAEDIGPGASREYRLDFATKEFAAAILTRKDFSHRLTGLTIRLKIHYVDAVHGTVRTYCLTMQPNDKGNLPQGDSVSLFRLRLVQCRESNRGTERRQVSSRMNLSITNLYRIFCHDSVLS